MLATAHGRASAKKMREENRALWHRGPITAVQLGNN